MRTPTVSFRMSHELRAQVDAVGRAKRWSFGEAMRVAAEQFVAAERAGTTKHGVSACPDAAQPEREHP